MNQSSLIGHTKFYKMNIDLLQTYVRKARVVLDNHHNDLNKNFFGNFPYGTCGNTSDMLAKWLQSKNIRGIEYVCGKRGTSSHGWLQLDKLIIDITSDQFEDGLGPVYVGKDRIFHDTFLNQKFSEPKMANALYESYSKFYELMEI